MKIIERESKHFWRIVVYIFYITLIFGNFYIDLFSFLGVLLAIFGVYLYIKSRKELTNYYSSHPRVFAKHKLIKTGLFRYVRHPSYLGSFVAMIGFILISKSIISLMYALIVCIPFGFYKISVEEKLLQKKFRKEFEKYKERVPMVIPKF